ncbi:hypothetical protein KC887_07270 [Candidatus Kaiserbacteria bacterium]|nr:hypothetical protein [Candidatus Kaiserbacteria bacterium]
MADIITSSQKVVVNPAHQTIRVVSALSEPENPGVAEAPIDGQKYTRQNGLWVVESPDPDLDLNDLQDVNASSPDDLDILAYDLGSNMWYPAEPAWVEKAGDTMLGSLLIASPYVLQVNQVQPYSGTTLTLAADRVNMSDKLYIGDDAFFEDVNQPHGIALKSQTDATQGRLILGSAGMYIHGGTGFLSLGNPGSMYVDASTHYFRDAGGTNKLVRQEDGLHLQAGAFRQYGTHAFYFQTYGGGWYMADTTWIRTYGSKSVYIDNSLGILNQIMVGDTSPPTGTIKGWFKRTTNTTSEAWHQAHICLRSDSASSYTKITFWTYNVAPGLKAYHGAEALEVRNGADSGFVPILASAFTVSSSLRWKKDVENLDDNEILDRARKVQLIRYRQKVRPQSVRPTKRFADVAKRWVERGHAPLTMTVEHTETGDHDCSIDPCNGTPENPCSEVLNDTPRLGLAAEAHAKHSPEATRLDSDGKVMGYDVDQVASTALATAGANTRRADEQEKRIEELESEVDYLKAELKELKALVKAKL